MLEWNSYDWDKHKGYVTVEMGFIPSIYYIIGNELYKLGINEQSVCSLEPLNWSIYNQYCS